MQGFSYFLGLFQVIMANHDEPSKFGILRNGWFSAANSGCSLDSKCYRVSKNDSTPKWMVYFMENPIKVDDLGGKPTI